MSGMSGLWRRFGGPVSATALGVGSVMARRRRSFGFRATGARLVVPATAASVAMPLRRGASTQALAFEAGMGDAAAEALRRHGLEVELVPCLGDNYCPIIHQPRFGVTIVMDTPDAKPITRVLRARGWSLTYILNTHHHADHVGGNLELKRAFPDALILGPKESIPGIDQTVGEGDEVQLGELTARVLDVGGHTEHHVAYFFPEVPLALVGDCLFTMGCGRVFTGDFALMYRSMAKLRALPDDTVVYCAHEYTASNVRFALEVEPENADLVARSKLVEELRACGKPTVPSLLGHEKATNPFLRYDAASVMEAVGGLQDPEAVFTAVRRWKDKGKRPELGARSKL